MKVQTSLIPVLTLAAAFAFAQQPGTTSPGQGPATEQQAPANPSASQTPQPSQGDAAGQAGAADANSTTVRGCLGTGANNTYTVTEDKTGTVYTLAGKDFSSLSSHVGQEVEADGQPMPGNATGSTGGAATDSTPSSSTTAFNVTHMRKVGDKCTSPKPSSSLRNASPVLMAQATGTAGAQTAQPGTASPGANGNTSTSGMSTSPQTTTPGQATPSTATPTTAPPTSPGTVNSTTPGTETAPGTAATPGAAGSSNANTTPGTQPPCATTGSATASSTPCSTPAPTPEATPGVTPDTNATPGTATPETAPPTSATPDSTSPSSTPPPKK